MGYLNNASVSVDAILTTKGRELLSQGTTNGLDIKVPTFIKIGDKVRIDTRTNEYMSRA